jgi:hypothetical protein
MEENWELRSLERRVSELEKENHRRSQRLTWWITSVLWTLYVVALTLLVVLAAVGIIHHH